MNQKQLDKIIQSQITKVLQTRKDGQLEYARDIENVFANFQRVGKYIGISQEKVLMVYLLKHIDGIMAHINGHESQRENVEGRIIDVHVYLLLLRGMLEQSATNKWTK